MYIDAYAINSDQDVAVSLGEKATMVLSRTEALDLAQKLLMALDECPVIEGRHKWLLLAGQQNSQVVDQIIGDFDDLHSIARAMAYQHKAAIWAVSFERMTSILAWPRSVMLTNTTKLAIIRQFVQRVNDQAEQNIEVTGKLEGAHHAAIQSELAKLELET